MEIGIILFLLLINGATIFGLSLLVEWLIIKHVMDNPAYGLIASIFGSFLLHLIYYIVGGDYDATGTITLFGGLILALLLILPGYLKRKKRFAEHQNIDGNDE